MRQIEPPKPQPASMRPGHEAPENAAGDGVDLVHDLASMRPGHEAPENVRSHEEGRNRLDAASMRPGHEAPENSRDGVSPAIESLLQ